MAGVSANFRNRPVTLVCQTPGENAHEEGFFLTPKAKETRAKVKKKKKILFQKSPLLEQQLQQTLLVKPSELSHF